MVRSNSARVLRGSAAALAGVLLLASCGSPSASNEIEHVDGGNRLVVPALWADTHQQISGIEPATVWAGTIGPPGFGIDLSTIEAQGAGAAWRAASASAAAVATMYSALDPADVDIDFTITGPIDGPSAGGILTVGVLAALRGVPLKPGVTMTGTISPDGSIGPIGGVDLKLKAAAEAGYTRVLLCPANMRLWDREADREVSAKEVGAALGLEVIEVKTVAEAFEQFTGEPLALHDPGDYVIPSQVLAAGEQTAVDLIATVEGVLSELEPGTDTDLRIEVADAKAALSADDPAAAYALAVDALLDSGRLRARQRTNAAIAAEGAGATQRALDARIQQAIQRGSASLRANSDVSTLGYEQQMSTPAALAWLAYPVAMLRVLDTRLAGDVDERTLIALAELVADQEAAIDHLATDALDVVHSMPSKPALSAGITAPFMSNYTNFLVRAARANQDYLDTVLLGGSKVKDAAADADITSLFPVVAELDMMATQIPAVPNELTDEIEQSATAMAYYVSTSALLTAIQAFGDPSFSPATRGALSGKAAQVAASIETSTNIIDGVADVIAARGLDAGYPSWSALWGNAAYRALSQRQREGGGAALALDELGYDAIALFMVNAAPRPGS